MHVWSYLNAIFQTSFVLDIDYETISFGLGSLGQTFLTPVFVIFTLMSPPSLPFFIFCDNQTWNDPWSKLYGGVRSLILINENSKKHWLSQCLHINIQVLHGGKLTLEGLTIMSEILMNCLDLSLRLQLGMASFS